jgi:myo-inositol-1-phosphate synthase
MMVKFSNWIIYFILLFIVLGVPSDYSIEVNGRNTIYSNEFIESKYIYEMNHCEVDHQAKKVNIIPRKYQYDFRTKRQVQRTGVMLVGWGGNNGTTVTGATIANRDNITWMRKGMKKERFIFCLI